MSDNHDLPPRLTEGEGPAADLLRRFVRTATRAPSESAAFDRTISRLASGRGRWLPMGLAAACGVLVGAAGLYVLSMSRLAEPQVSTRPRSGASTPLLSPPRAPVAQNGAPDRPVTRSGSTRTSADTDEPLSQVRPNRLGSAPSVPVSDPAPRIALGRAAVGLPVGDADLLGEAHVSLSPGGRAQAFADERAATVKLAAGKLVLQVDKRRAGAGRRFDVVTGPYRFTVLGTVFEVSRQGAVVQTSVTEGRVAVYRGTRLRALVDGGGHWTSASGHGGLSPATVVAPPPLLVPDADKHTQAPNHDRCAKLARADAQGAVACYLGEARGRNLGAEVGLYEVARLRRDALSDPAGALQALEEHRRRFPAGALATEAELSIVELLPRLGRHREALERANALLSIQPQGERLAELHLLRGHIYREQLGDCASAERAYAAALAAGASKDRVGDPAAFWRAVCLEKLGRCDQAVDAYRRYLDRPNAALADQATTRLAALEGTAACEHSGLAHPPSSHMSNHREGKDSP